MKTLIVSLDNLGDCVMALGLSSAVRAAAPEMEVGCWLKAYAADLLEFVPGETAGFFCDPFWDRSPGGGKGSWGAYLRTLSEVRRNQFDSALILHANWKKALSCRAAAIPSRWGLAGPGGVNSLTRTVPILGEAEHILDASRRLAEAFLGRAIPPIRCEMTLEPRHETELQRLRVTFPGPWWVMHPFSGDLDKNWPLSSWLRLMDILLEEHEGVLWVIATPADVADCAGAFHALRDRHRGRVALGWEAAPSLREMLLVLGGARGFIGNDSGPLHAACAFGVPSVGLYRYPNELLAAARGRSRPSVLSRDPLSAVDVDEVLAAARDLFK
jgi:ADP-heptose:LPS heptosyltransferase